MVIIYLVIISTLYAHTHTQEGLWTHYVNNGSTNSMLEYYYCPAGYCQCRRIGNISEVCSSVYYYNNENLQCVCDRQGNIVVDWRNFICSYLCIM